MSYIVLYCHICFFLSLLIAILHSPGPGTTLDMSSNTSGGLEHYCDGPLGRPLLIICGGINLDNSYHLAIWSLHSSRSYWQKETTLQNGGARGICLLGDAVLVVGSGISGVQCEIYEKSRWYSLPNMLMPRVAFGTVIVGRRVFVIGGKWQNTGKSALHVECFDMDTKEWQRCSRQPSEFLWPLLTRVRNQVIVLPTDDNCDYFNIYDALNDRFTNKCSLPSYIRSFRGACATSLGDDVFVIGGRFDLFDQYNIITNTWTNLTSGPQFAHLNAACMVVAGKLMVFGGYDEDSIEEYDFDNGMWKERSLRMPANICCYTVLKP